MVLEKIEIQHELSFDELCKRLRNVRLRGFPDVKIYEDSSFRIERFTPEHVVSKIFTPQPSIYLPMLKRIEIMKGIFTEKGIDIFNLNGGFDYFAFDDSGEETNWTIIPPVIERIPIKINSYGKFDYCILLSDDLKAKLNENGFKINPCLENMIVEGSVIVWMDTICDGAHRVHYAIKEELEQNLLMIDNIKEGYPYYALPKPYSHIHEESERIEEKIDKLHVLDAPAHKLLYRLFPSGGIYSGDTRSKTR